MYVFIEIPSGSQPISHLLLGENFRKFPEMFRKFPPNVKFSENLQPYFHLSLPFILISNLSYLSQFWLFHLFSARTVTCHFGHFNHFYIYIYFIFYIVPKLLQPKGRTVGKCCIRLLRLDTLPFPVIESIVSAATEGKFSPTNNWFSLAVKQSKSSSSSSSSSYFI